MRETVKYYFLVLIAGFFVSKILYAAALISMIDWRAFP